jgi:hypothetical protein
MSPALSLAGSGPVWTDMGHHAAGFLCLMLAVSVGACGSRPVACTGGLGSADPATRLAEFVTWFDDDRRRLVSECQPDHSQTLTTIGGDLAAIMRAAQR